MAIMFKRISQAFSLFKTDFGVLASIGLTVWLPGNLVSNLVDRAFPDAGFMASLRITMLIELAFGPLCTAGIIHVLSRRMQGESTSYREAMSFAVKKWWPVLAANLTAGIRVLLGCLALIVPGIALAVRYSLIDAVVVLENKDTYDARMRSIELTAGRRRDIFFSYLLFFIALIVVIFAVYAPVDDLSSLSMLPVELLMDCTVDIFAVIIQIVMFLFFWEAVQTEKEASAVETAVPAAQGSPLAG